MYQSNVGNKAALYGERRVGRPQVGVAYHTHSHSQAVHTFYFGFHGDALRFHRCCCRFDAVIDQSLFCTLKVCRRFQPSVWRLLNRLRCE